MRVRFELDVNELTAEDFMLIEDAADGVRPFSSMVKLMARFIADENGQLVGQEKGVEILKPLKMPEFNQVAQAFGEAIQRKAVPPKINAA